MKSYQGKTILVTGATGLIGSHIVDQLMLQDNIRVIALGRNQQKLDACFQKYKMLSSFCSIAADIGGNFQINEKIDYIFHAAGLISGEAIHQRPVDVIKPNIIGTINCLEILRKQETICKHRGRLVLFSSATVYGETNEEHDKQVKEDDVLLQESLNSRNAPYSQSKRMVEVLALAYCRQYGIDVVTVRPSYVYGYSLYHPNTAIYNFFEKAVCDEEIVLMNAGSPRRDYIYVDDVVRGILITGLFGITGEAYNVSSNSEKQNFAALDEIAEAILFNAAKIKENVTQRSIRCLEQITKHRAAGVYLDNSKLKSLGWQVETSLDEGLMRVLQSYQQELAKKN